MKPRLKKFLKVGVWVLGVGIIIALVTYPMVGMYFSYISISIVPVAEGWAWREPIALTACMNANARVTVRFLVFFRAV